eukprot:jgi/Psemu1/5361/gm1.5361_g
MGPRQPLVEHNTTEPTRQRDSCDMMPQNRNKKSHHILVPRPNRRQAHNTTDDDVPHLPWSKSIRLSSHSVPLSARHPSMRSSDPCPTHWIPRNHHAFIFAFAFAFASAFASASASASASAIVLHF